MFIGGQIYEFTEFYREGLSLSTNVFGSSFFVLTGFHGAHVTAGIVWLLSLWGLSMQGKIAVQDSEKVEIAGLYWHFVDVVWIVIFTVIYLIPAVRTTSVSDEQALLPGTAEERSEEAEYGLSVISPDEVPLLPGEERSHPSPFQYVVIFVVLCVVTAAEIGLYYLEDELPWGLIVGLLLTLAVIKFIMVASWYMHLRTDKPIFRRFFTIGVIAAVLLYTIVLTTFRVFD